MLRLFRRPDPSRPALPDGCVATIGAFDGVHLGHRRIIECVRKTSTERGLPALVFSFEPTPREFFQPDSPPARLTRFREKFDALAGLGVEYLFCPPFNRQLGNLEPEEFVVRILSRILQVRHVVVGDDFRFARGRSGDIDDLRRGGKEHGFSVEQVGSVELAGLRVSSTAIRHALEQGDLQTATAMLDRPYRMSGRVVDGRKLGKELGYPTANINLGRRASPVQGIFAVRVSGLPGPILDGVASVGTRPTVDGVEPLLEVHIFDFRQDIYGQLLHVDFVAKLRDEEKFPDLESLRVQMDVDAAQARQILAAA